MFGQFDFSCWQFMFHGVGFELCGIILRVCALKLGPFPSWL
jgi:hypothetical protein